MEFAAIRPLLLAGLAALAGCTSAPPLPSDLPDRSAIRNFGLEARFALRLERPYEPPQSASGRLSWLHIDNRDRILVADPLGQGIAEIQQDPASAVLRTSDGRERQAPDAAALLQEATGYPLPVGELPAWLLGRPSASGQVQTDPAGRPKRLSEAGWQIEYDYDHPAAGALPSRLTLRRSNNLELRLRIEEWRNAP